jgi:hypothetical protein
MISHARVSGMKKELFLPDPGSEAYYPRQTSDATPYVE